MAGSSLTWQRIQEPETLSGPSDFDLAADEIVSAAVDIFREEGLDAVSMRSVSARLGVSPVFSVMNTLRTVAGSQSLSGSHSFILVSRAKVLTQTLLASVPILLSSNVTIVSPEPEANSLILTRIGDGMAAPAATVVAPAQRPEAAQCNVSQ